MSIILPEEYAAVGLIAIALAMDCFAVSVCKGMAVKKDRAKTAFLMSFLFGTFQAAMSLIGWAAGTSLLDAISVYDHWIAFGLLAAVGGKMVHESLGKKEIDECRIPSLRELLVLSVATSIDALAVGLSFAFLRMSILSAAAIIGIASFILSLAGFYAGKHAGKRFGGYAEALGGVILVCIGLKILLEHAGLI